MKPLCIYHGHCDDGFAAAWSVHRALGDQVEFYPGVHQKAPPDVTGRDVILVDFSYKRPTLEAMAKGARSVLVLDHHHTAFEDLVSLGMQVPPDATWADWESIIESPVSDGMIGALFDMNRSGAGIAWDFFHDAPRPLGIDYIEDRDLWRKHLPGGDEFTIALRSYPQEFETWDRILGNADALISEGKAIQRYYRLRVEELKRSAYKASITPYSVDGEPVAFPVAVANAPYFAASEVAGEIIDLFPDVLFGASYFEVAGGRWQYSLRSRGEFDVSAVAKAFGGGGHKPAAGFTADRPVHIRL